jgi:hypothetical protein
MAGELNGVAAKFLEQQPRALFVHCQAHRLNLAIQDAMSCVAPCNQFLSMINDIVQFIRDSPKRLAEFKSIADSTGVPSASLRPLCPTRWTLRLRSFLSVKESFDPLRLQLRNMASNMNVDRNVRAKASGFASEMNSLRFIFWLTVSIEIFEQTTLLSKLLQSSTLSAGEGKRAAMTIIDVLSNYRKDEHFIGQWKTVTDLQTAFGIPEPPIPRCAKRPARFDEGSETYQHQSAEDHFRCLYWQLLDSIIQAITSRFHSKGHQITETIEMVLFSGFSSQPVTDDALQVLSDHFRQDISIPRLRSELNILANLPQAAKVTDIPSAVKTLKELGESLNLLKNVRLLLQLYLILPSSTATAERSFSTLRRIKTYLRSSMSQARLNHVLVLTTYKNAVDDLDMDELLAEFIKRNELRRSTFSLP